MGISVVVVDGPVLEWGLREIYEMIGNFKHVMEPGTRSPLSKGRNFALDIQFLPITRPIF